MGATYNLVPSGDKAYHPLLGVSPKPGPLGSDIYYKNKFHMAVGSRLDFIPTLQPIIIFSSAQNSSHITYYSHI